MKIYTFSKYINESEPSWLEQYPELKDYQLGSWPFPFSSKLLYLRSKNQTWFLFFTMHFCHSDFFPLFPPYIFRKIGTLFILFSELPSYISVETIKSYFFHVFKGRKFLKILWFSPYILMNQITLSKIFHMQLWFHSIALRYIRWKPSSENLIPFTKGSLMSERFSLWLHLQKKAKSLSWALSS